MPLHFILSAHSSLPETMDMDMNMDMTTAGEDPFPFVLPSSSLPSSDPNESTSVHYKMWMWFHTEINDTIWFDWWHIIDVPSESPLSFSQLRPPLFSVLIWACLIVFVFGISLELLKFIRYKVQIKLHQSNGPSSEK